MLTKKQRTRKLYGAIILRKYGRRTSTMSMSLENLESNLPIGVDSKKNMGCRNILCSKLSWSLNAALLVPYTYKISERYCEVTKTNGKNV